MSFSDTWSPRALAALRIMAALLFIEHGLMKLIEFPAAIPGVPTPLPLILQVAAWMEVVGGVLMAVGLFTRPVAFLLSGEMAAAYFMGHAPKGFWPAINQGELAILYCFIFLYFAAQGAGAWSVDGILNGNRTQPATATS